MINNTIKYGLKPNLATAVRTLTAGGFILKRAERKPGYSLLYFSRFDEFGSIQEYCFVVTSNHISVKQIKGATIAAKHHNAKLVIIGRGDGKPRVEWDRFINLFGGPVVNTSPLDPIFSKQLVKLSHNELPTDIKGKPDDLFELFTHTALEFIFGGRVVRYGQVRRYEPIPDGLIIPDLNFSALYDTKASVDGYKLTIGGMRQFKSYVTDFQSRYSSHIQINSFIVISSDFKNTKTTLEKRSKELQAETRVPMSFLDIESFKKILKLLIEYPLMRRSINWSRVFSEVIVQTKIVKKEIERIKKDEIVRR